MFTPASASVSPSGGDVPRSRYDSKSGAPFGVGCASSRAISRFGYFAHLRVDNPVGDQTDLRIFDVGAFTGHDRDRVMRVIASM